MLPNQRELLKSKTSRLSRSRLLCQIKFIGFSFRAAVFALCAASGLIAQAAPQKMSQKVVAHKFVAKKAATQKPALKIVVKSHAKAQDAAKQDFPTREAARSNGNQVVANPSSFEALKLTQVKDLPLNPERASIPTAERLPLDEQKRQKVTAELQGLLVDLTDLRMQTTEAHWDLVGPLYLPIHEQLGEFADRYAKYIDRVAERSLSLGYSVDGRPQTVVKTSSLPVFPGGFVRDSEAIDLISDRLDTTAIRTRARMERISDLDPVTENMLQDIIEGLEHDLWQIRVHKQ